MRISDWSSDVCSSDLQLGRACRVDARMAGGDGRVECTACLPGLGLADRPQAGGRPALSLCRRGAVERRASRGAPGSQGVCRLARLCAPHPGFPARPAVAAPTNTDLSEEGVAPYNAPFPPP